MKARKKRYMTLIETLVALALLSVLLVFVFGLFRQFSVINQALDQSERKSFQMRYIEIRLGYIFDRIVNENANDRIFYFYTESSENRYASQNLIFTFNNEARSDPLFSSDVIGKLYVDDKERFILATWPLISETPKAFMQEEVLAYGVKEVKYSFYSPPERIRDNKDISTPKIDPEKKTPPKDEWTKEWFATYDQMPVIIKMTLEFETPSLAAHKLFKSEHPSPSIVDFYFVLPSSKNPVNYPPNKTKVESKEKSQ